MCDAVVQNLDRVESTSRTKAGVVLKNEHSMSRVKLIEFDIQESSSYPSSVR